MDLALLTAVALWAAPSTDMLVWGELDKTFSSTLRAYVQDLPWRTQWTNTRLPQPDALLQTADRRCQEERLRALVFVETKRAGDVLLRLFDASSRKLYDRRIPVMGASREATQEAAAIVLQASLSSMEKGEPLDWTFRGEAPKWAPFFGLSAITLGDGLMLAPGLSLAAGFGRARITGALVARAFLPARRVVVESSELRLSRYGLGVRGGYRLLQTRKFLLAANFGLGADFHRRSTSSPGGTPSSWKLSARATPSLLFGIFLDDTLLGLRVGVDGLVERPEYQVLRADQLVAVRSGWALQPWASLGIFFGSGSKNGPAVTRSSGEAPH